MMDFQKLLQQAANNQASKQKELKSKLKEVENEKKIALHQEIEKKREAKKKLSQYEEDTIKQRLMYHGLVSSSGKPLNNVRSPSASVKTRSTANTTGPSKSITSGPSKAIKTPSASTGRVSAKTDSTSSNVSRHPQAQSVTKQSNNPRSRGSSPKPTSSKSSTIKKQPKSSLSSSKNSAVSKQRITLPPGRLKPKPMPTDFQELLKLAQKNSKKTTPTSITVSGSSNAHTTSLTQQKTTPNSIGIGRSLLQDKHTRKEPSKPLPAELSSIQCSSGSVSMVQNGGSISESSKLGKKKPGEIPKGKSSPANLTSKGQKASSVSHVVNSSPMKNNVTSNRGSQVKDRVYPYPKPYAGMDQSKPHPQSGSTSNGVTVQDPMMKSKLGRGRGNPTIRGRNGMNVRGRGLPPPKSRNPNKFYSSSARIITDKSSGGSSSRNPMLGYRSTWADQMSDYLHNHKNDLMEDDDDYYDEDEFDDFVVDEDDDDTEGDMGEDYSSAIQSIFGDRYRSAANEDDDVIESSFAQQEFEEMRSARIGKMEDEEDIRREREELERKRKQNKGPKPPSKRTKH